MTGKLNAGGLWDRPIWDVRQGPHT